MSIADKIQKIVKNKKRQWGSEKNLTPLPMLHEKPSLRKLTMGRIAIILTVVFWILYIFSIIVRQLIEGPQSYQFTMEAFSYATVVSFLTFSALMYLVARQGALERFSTHTRVPRALLDRFFSKHTPKITVLVPSYNEENEVVRKTLLSAALQEYPEIRVVLLLDDKPHPTNPDEIERLEKARNIGKELSKLLHDPLIDAKKALKSFEKKSRKTLTSSDVEALANHYDNAADWLMNMANSEKIEDHVDVFFTEQVYIKLAQDLSLVSKALRMSIKDKESVSYERARQLYKRLVWIFKAEFEVFERKAYASTSHEANKAMNLNSYIGLMGGTYTKEETPQGTILIPTKKKSSKTITILNSEFLLTLDADSVLLREYCLRLVYFLMQPENERVAVTQTPYSSFRGAFSRIERLAAATTDIQHILHQGMTQHGATFWVGANAVIRKSAIEDIVEYDRERGFEIKRYIQDRTVIEDTESSVDLALHGWELVNYPERLSYSATPPDFGSLVVQRRRWANGGLLILPKLFATMQARKREGRPLATTSVLLRINYMASIAWATFGLIFLLAYPYDGRLLSPLVVLAALPYFLAMASDLKYCGYKYSDVFRIYGFNLIMLPVNLAGVLKSIEQAMTGKKIPFARTPKVKNRTPSSMQYVIVPVLIVAFSLFTVYRNILIQNWGNAAFAAFNAFVATWAILAYIGAFNIIVDTWLGIINWIYVDVKPKKQTVEITDTDIDWKVVLYHGENQGILPFKS